MKNYILIIIGYSLFLTSCTSQLILRKSQFTGKENKVNRVDQYNLKAKTVSFKTKSNIEVKSIFLKHKDYKFIKSKLKQAGIKNNFCWNSISTYPEYTFRYEIIFEEGKKMSQCTNRPVRQEIYDSFIKATDTIKKRIIVGE